MTLVDRIRTALADTPNVQEKRMFGGVGFMVRGKLCLSARQKRMMCRIDPALHDDVLRRKSCRTVVMKGRSLRGYVRVEASKVRTRRDLDYWVALALDYNRQITESVKKKPRRLS
ncbi:MAG TPA: TfoX/Sxy family protein [Candidatus Eremiobacteraceae bacterium]|nr:TfoX/Sxy family protein [Candidatus Eremiobacteraceae bacterium]